jgi:GGDEF domain-containing protein
MGGSEVGDDALASASALMEQAVAAAGVKGEVYRYGGDEFTIQVDGGSDAANRVIQALEDLRKGSEPIPRGPRSRDEYAPTRLSFNYGLSDRAMLDELFRVATKEGVVQDEDFASPARIRNVQAELMTKAADVGIEYNKAYSRFMLLIDELRDPDYASDPARKKQVDALISFSNKAVFAELGGADHLRLLAAEVGLEGEKLEEAVLDYVVEKVGETRAREKAEKSELDRLLAAQVRLAFFEARVRTLEQENAGLKERNQEQEIALARTVSQRDLALLEKQEIVEMRKSLDD